MSMLCSDFQTCLTDLGKWIALTMGTLISQSFSLMRVRM
jgi:hypothetical protein